MAKREKAPHQKKNLIITQCAFRQDSVSETRQYLKDAGHRVTMTDESIAKKLTNRDEHLTSQGMMEDHLDCQQAGKISGLTARRVRAYCMEGRLGRKLTSNYIISREEMLAFIQVKRLAGIPGQRARAEEKAG